MFGFDAAGKITGIAVGGMATAPFVGGLLVMTEGPIKPSSEPCGDHGFALSDLG